jgi:hypothetical protein
MLFVKNNLNDVENIGKIAKNLQLGDIVDMESDHVVITRGSITTNVLGMNFFSSTTNSFLKCDDNSGNVSITEYTQPEWIKNNRKEISIDIFKNDIDAIMIHDVVGNMFSNNFEDLLNKPSLGENILEHVYNLYAESDSNMSDCIVDNLNSALGLNKIVYSNVYEDLEILKVKTENIFFEGLTVSKPGLLSVNDTVLYLDNFPYATNFLYGRSRFINANDEYISLLLPTNLFIQEYFGRLSTKIETKKNELLEYVKKLLAYIDKYSSIYLKKDKYLDDLNNQSICRRNLKIDKFYDSVSISDSELNIENIRIEVYSGISRLKLMNISRLDELQTFGYLYYTDENEYGYVRRDEFADASLLTRGVCKIDVYFEAEITKEEDKTFNTMIYVSKSKEHEESIIQFLETIPTIQDSILRRNIEINSKNRLLRKSSNLDELEIVDDMMEIYTNLGIHEVGYTSDYDKLYNNPMIISRFSNDIPYLEINNNFSEIMDVGLWVEARNNLLVGSLGSQNIDAVDMIGDEFNMDYLSITSSMYINSNAEAETFLAPYGWEKLYEYDIENQEEFGIVILNDQVLKINDYIDIYLCVDSDENAVYSTQILIEFEKKINYELDKLYEEVQSLRNFK